MMREKIVKLQMEICSKVMRSGYYAILDPPLDLRLDVEDLYEDLQCLRQLQDLEMDSLTYGEIKLEDE